ncbi:MAG TPA: hypothetical protein VMZ30_06935 [Pyrinomonadaceae bacterium]|nr:hypothetical protein [Pyrinomonadaceae bacterium]
MNRILSSHIRRMVCTKGRLALTLTLTLVTLFTTAGVLAKDYSLAGGNVASGPTSFMTSLSSVPSMVTARFFNATSLTSPQSLTPTPLPGICSNAPTTACSVNADCPSGGTCKIPTAGGDLTPNTKCLAQASGIAGGCTANDVSVAQTTSLRVEDRDPIAPGVQGCLGPNDTATVSFVAQFHSTATARYDVGVWTSQNGGSALTGAEGTCSVADFPSSPTPPWFNQEASIPTDVCGDISSSADVYSSINNIQVACVDTNGDGNLDINTCLSWSQLATKKSSDACTTPLQATAGTTSKCNCGKLPGIAILVPGKIKVDKVTRDQNGNAINDPTLFNFTISGPDGDLPDNFQLANATAVHESPGLTAAAGAGTQYAVTEQPNSSWTTTATCTSDQFQADGVTPRPAQNPFAGNGMVTLHAGETLTCTYTNRLIDRCAGVTCQASTACASYSCDGSDGLCKATYQPAGTACGDSSSSTCDAADTCNGSGTCQVNHVADGTNCGDAGTECTNQDTCSAGVCHDNGFKSAATACGSSSDTACDNPDHCSGTDGSCVPNHAADGTNCGDAGTQCTNQDTCSGGECQDNGFKPQGTTCTGNSNGGACDAPDSCNGSGTCVDGFDTPPTVTLGLNLLCENGDGLEQGGATPTQLVATVSPIGGSYSYSWTGPDGPIATNGAAITPTKPGTYIVVVTDTATSCPNDAGFKLCFTGEQFDVASAAPTQQPQATASFTVPARSQPTGFRAYLAKLLSVFG